MLMTSVVTSAHDLCGTSNVTRLSVMEALFNAVNQPPILYLPLAALLPPRVCTLAAAQQVQLTA